MIKIYARQLFTRFYRHLPRRLFQRDLMLDGLKTSAGRNVPVALTRTCLDCAQATEPALYARFSSRPQGLDAAGVAVAHRQYGPNSVAAEQPLTWWRHLWSCYRNPFNILLTMLGIVSYGTDDVIAAVVIALMVMIATLLNFIQEARSNKAADALKAMVSNTATVLRADGPGGSGVYQEIAMVNLVPGDIVKLSAGDMIPADLRLLQARDLFIGQAALTGEALPVEKKAGALQDPGRNPLECDNLCFMGTNVISGTALAIIIGTGDGTWFGQLAGQSTAQCAPPNAFQLGISRVSWLLIRFMLVMTPVVLLVNGFTKGDWWEAALFSLSVAVGLTPEMLPMIVTSSLAKGAVQLSRQKVIVKRLDAIQNFGAMDILCTDKTGTLTQDKIVLASHTDAFGHRSERVLQNAWLNSHHQTGLKNLLDKAVLEKVTSQEAGLAQARWRKIDEIPFDFERRRMSVIVGADDGQTRLICKGALEEVLAVCSRVRHGDEIAPLDAALLEQIGAVTGEFSLQGLRVVAVAGKPVADDRIDFSRLDESDLILEGYIAFLDPPKESTAPALEALARHGIQVKILTGDNERVAAKVCKDVGLSVDKVLTGDEIEGLDDRQLALAARATTVFAKLTPLQKARIVSALRREGHVVGFMGDGINDAPALRAADIGISVDSAVDIAKEAADIILLEKSLMVLEEGVIEGRRTFVNMMKYIRMTASSNFGNVFSVLVASAFLPFLPMLPLHLLVQNLIYDISQVAIPFDKVDEDQLRQPQRWRSKDLGRFMVFFGPISSIFDILTFCLMWWVFKANTPEQQTLFQTGWFVVGVLSQTLVVHMLRTRKIPFLQSRPSWALGITALTVIIVTIGMTFTPVAGFLHLQALPGAYWPWLVAILVGYMALVQSMKGWFVRRYGWQ